MGGTEDLAGAARSLRPAELRLLETLALTVAEPGPREPEIPADSDLCAPDGFAGHFGGRLRLHHALSGGPAKIGKGEFVAALVGASRAAGRSARVLRSGPADAEVAGERFSLRTEGAANALKDSVTVSRFAHGAWIRRARGKRELADGAVRSIGASLAGYDRALVLRSVAGAGGGRRYDLFEVPKPLLERALSLGAEDFDGPTRTNTAKAVVGDGRGGAAFRVVLDGSSGKIMVRSLLLSLCRAHGSWHVPADAELAPFGSRGSGRARA